MHYPVVNRNGDIITSAVTNLDIHDMSRAAKTYGVKAFYIVTPLMDQQRLVKKITLHWTEGAGAEYNPTRRKALELISIKSSLDEVVGDIRNKCESFPKIVVTSSKNFERKLDIADFRTMLQNAGTYLLLFGTAWGLTEEFINSADYLLEPIKGCTDYNHLSVRSAAAIMLDRLLGSRKSPFSYKKK